MRRIKQAKPSAALIVAVVALVAALGGGAVAGVAVTSLSKKDKKQVKRIAKKLDKKPLKKAKRAREAANGAQASAEGAQASADTAQGRNVAAAFSEKTIVTPGADPTEVASSTITLDERSRLLASATLTAGNSTGIKLVRCWLNAGGDPDDEANDISGRPISEVADFQGLAVNGSVVKDPGTHTVRLYCEDFGADIEVSDRDLIVWAAAP